MDGSVNVPGVTAAELAGVKTIAQNAAAEASAAKSTATAAATAAGAAQADATAALNRLKEMLGGAMPSGTLANNTPAVIQAVASLGLGEHFWNVGDRVPITLNGKVSQLSLNGTYYAFIIGFNHNRGLEGGNSIHFQFGKTAAGVDIAFQSGYDDDSDFQMNPGNNNAGGWRDCPMRAMLNRDFLAAMPIAWRNVIVECAKYTDNVGNATNLPGNISPTADKIWLLSEFEVHGKRSYANTSEQNYQKQYAYYANGNSKVKYRHDSTGSVFFWWLRSPGCTGSDYFCHVDGTGAAGTGNAEYSAGVAPGFVVA